MSKTVTVTEKEVTIAGAPYKEVTTATATVPDPGISTASAESAAGSPPPSVPADAGKQPPP